MFSRVSRAMDVCVPHRVHRSRGGDVRDDDDGSGRGDVALAPGRFFVRGAARRRCEFLRVDVGDVERWSSWGDVCVGVRRGARAEVFEVREAEEGVGVAAGFARVARAARSDRHGVEGRWEGVVGDRVR